jgi:glycosyltransferase involved in cell wall biosynthesis
MRVAYLSASGQLGGTERCLLDLVAELRDTRPDCALHVVLGAPGPLGARLAALAVPSTVLPMPAALARVAMSGSGAVALGGRLAVSGLALLRYRRHLARTLRDLGPDVIHSNGLAMHPLAARAAPAGVPVVWHLHDFVRRRPLTRRLVRLDRRRCAAIIASSAAVAADARTVVGPRCAIHPVPCGVDLTAFSPDGPTVDLDRLAGLTPPPTAVVRVGLVATMGRAKGHEVFFQALARMPAALPIRAYVVGGPIDRTGADQYSLDELRERAARAGVAARVGFTGFVDEPATAMRALDVVVHASTAPEPFGLVVAEAMACGRPVVMSAASGIADYLVPERDVLTFAPGHAAALAARLERLVSEEDLRHRLGKAGRLMAEHRFDRVRVGHAVAAIYDALGPRPR